MTYLADLTERTVTVYVLSFLGLALASYLDVISMGFQKEAVVSVLPAAFQIFTGAMAAFKGNPRTAGFTETRDYA